MRRSFWLSTAIRLPGQRRPWSWAASNLDPGVDIRGVILSRVNGSRHASVIRQSIEEYAGLPVYGIVPRMPDLPFMQRHMGLIPPEEHDRVHRALERAGAIAGTIWTFRPAWGCPKRVTLERRCVSQSDKSDNH